MPRDSRLTRQYSLRVDVTAEEKALVHRAARIAGASVCTWARMNILTAAREILRDSVQHEALLQGTGSAERLRPVPPPPPPPAPEPPRIAQRPPAKGTDWSDPWAVQSRARATESAPPQRKPAMRFPDRSMEGSDGLTSPPEGAAPAAARDAGIEFDVD